MPITAKLASENLPLIGTVESPSWFSDGEDVTLCYEIAPVEGGGNAILEFEDVFHFEQNARNTRDLTDYPYPVKPLGFNEIFGSERTERSRILASRFWVISFNDVTVEIVFRSVRIAFQNNAKERPSAAIRAYLARSDIRGKGLDPSDL